LINNTSDLNGLSTHDTDGGYYSASLITWVNMFIKPFADFNSYLLPNKIELTVDPEPTYLIFKNGIY
jgi:hypothetical protein